VIFTNFTIVYFRLTHWDDQLYNLHDTIRYDRRV